MPSAAAQGAAPSWSAGDYWEYAGHGTLQNVTWNVLTRLEVVEKTAIMAGGTSYEAYRAVLTMSENLGGTTNSVLGERYFRVTDLALIHILRTLNSQEYNVTFEPPLESFHFPLIPAEEWTMTTSERVTTNVTSYAVRHTYEFGVSGPVTMTVPAGTFSAYNVTRTEDGVPSNVSTDFYSDSVGFALRISGLLVGFPEPFPMDLRSYNYQNGALTGLLVVVGIVVAIVVIAVIAAAIRMRGMKRPAAPPRT